MSLRKKTVIAPIFPQLSQSVIDETKTFLKCVIDGEEKNSFFLYLIPQSDDPIEVSTRVFQIKESIRQLAVILLDNKSKLRCSHDWSTIAKSKETKDTPLADEVVLDTVFMVWNYVEAEQYQYLPSSYIINDFAKVISKIKASYDILKKEFLRHKLEERKTKSDAAAATDVAPVAPQRFDEDLPQTYLIVDNGSSNASSV